MIIPVFEASERTLCRLLPYKWLSTQVSAPTPASATAQATGASALGLCKASQLAGSLVELEQTVSRTLSSVTAGQLGKKLSHSRQASHLPQNISTPTAGGYNAYAADQEHNTDSAVLDIQVARDADRLNELCTADTSATISPAGADHQWQASVAAGQALPSAPRASLLLRLVTRTVITGCMVLVACALPFFGGIMGFFGETCSCSLRACIEPCCPHLKQHVLHADMRTLSGSAACVMCAHAMRVWAPHLVMINQMLHTCTWMNCF